MSTALATSNGGAVSSRPAGSLISPAGTGAVGVVAVSIARMSVLIEQALKALQILDDVGRDLLIEATISDDLAQHLTASFGERISLDQIRAIAGMLTQISQGSLGLVGQALDASRMALVSNVQVQRAQEGVHATGADGGYIDSQRRVG